MIDYGTKKGSLGGAQVHKPVSSKAGWQGCGKGVAYRVIDLLAESAMGEIRGLNRLLAARNIFHSLLHWKDFCPVCRQGSPAGSWLFSSLAAFSHNARGPGFER